MNEFIIKNIALIKHAKSYYFQDERFNHDIDVLTGYKTRTLLCMPIKDFNGDVIGVAQVDKMNTADSALV